MPTAAKTLENQTVSLLYLSPADSRRINTRFYGVRQTGIYKGFYPTITSGANVSISAGICEIADYAGGDWQVKVVTTDVTVTSTAYGEYLVLRWTYTGDETADVLTVLSVTDPDEKDLVIAKVGASYVFDFSDSVHPRSQPNTLDMNFKVVENEMTSAGMRVQVKAGYLQTPVGSAFYGDQVTSVITPPTVAATSRVYLVYLNSAGQALIDTTGTAVASPTTPSAPAYAGKTVIAEVTVANGDTAITQSMIKDVRTFISPNLLDEDDFASDSDKKGATQQSIKKYVNDNTLISNSAQFQTASIPANAITQLMDFSDVVGTRRALIFARIACHESDNRWFWWRPSDDVVWESTLNTASPNAIYVQGSNTWNPIQLITGPDGKIYCGSNYTNDFTIVLVGYMLFQ